MRGIDVHEGRARAETDEQEPVAGGCALSVEIDDGVATALARTEQERIIARAAGQLVDATAAVEQVGAAIAVELVVEAVAVALQVGGALQHQRFYVRRQRKMGSRKSRVVALASALEHGVAGIVDEIGVVADPAQHGVSATAAIEQIAAGIAVELVVEAVAVALQI